MQGEGHETGSVEHSVGFDRRNFIVPIPQVASFEVLNAHLLAQCLADDRRQVTGQATTIGEAWRREQPSLRPLPTRDVDCWVTRPAPLTPYSQVVFETNRYSGPADSPYAQVVIKADPFQLEILHLDRCWPAIPAAMAASKISLILCTTCPCWSSGRAPSSTLNRSVAGARAGPHL